MAKTKKKTEAEPTLANVFREVFKGKKFTRASWNDSNKYIKKDDTIIHAADIFLFNNGNVSSYLIKEEDLNATDWIEII